MPKICKNNNMEDKFCSTRNFQLLEKKHVSRNMVVMET